jgi:hypothetical protein
LKVVDGSGQTALHHAAALGSEQAVKALLGAGADRTIQDRRGRTAVDLALLRKKSDPEQAGILKQLKKLPVKPSGKGPKADPGKKNPD